MSTVGGDLQPAPAATPATGAVSGGDLIWRAGRSRVEMRARAVLVLAVALAGCGSDGRSPSADGLATYREEQRGFAVSYPEGWRRAPTSLTPGLTDPREIVSLGTATLPPGGPCGHLPAAAVRAMGPEDAVVSIQERAGRPTSEFVERSRPFELGEPTDSGDLPACVGEHIHVREWFVPFRDGDRGFYAIVALGASISEERRAETLRILDSLEFFGPGRSEEHGTP